jgi:hypothetical protein
VALSAGVSPLSRWRSTQPNRSAPCGLVCRFELGAVLDVTCTRCGGRGHLKTDCYAALDTQYDLLPGKQATAETEPEAATWQCSLHPGRLLEASANQKLLIAEVVFAIPVGLSCFK